MIYQKVYNHNCLEGISQIEDNSVDMVILDPDYDQWESFCKQGLIEQSTRVLKDTGNIICFTKQPFDLYLRNYVAPMFRREFVWTFENGGAWVSKMMPLVSTQKIYWLTKSKDFYFNPRTGLDYSDTTKNFKRKTKVFEGYNQEGREFEKSDEGTWMRDHYHFNKPSMGAIPAKPVELLQIFIHCMTKEEDLVLDPFAGSGNAGIACAKEKRRYIGFELDEDCYRIAKDRLTKELSQPTLF